MLLNVWLFKMLSIQYEWPLQFSVQKCYHLHNHNILGLRSVSDAYIIEQWQYYLGYHESKQRKTFNFFLKISCPLDLV